LVSGAAGYRCCDAYFYHAVAHLGCARNGYNPMMPENSALQKLVSRNNVPQRVVSLQPSVTVTLRDLGLLSRLVACTKYCTDVCPEVVTAGCMIVEDSWSAKAEQVLAAKPDLVIASVPYRLESVAEIIKSGMPFLGLAPKCLADVYQDILMIARIVSSEESGLAETRGLALVERMQKDISAVREKISRENKSHEERPLVYCEEWGKPLILSQTWVAELVEVAGGRFFGEPGKHTTEEEVIAADPDVIVAAWCGAGDRVPLEKIIPRRGWEHTKAAQNGRVYCINDEFLNTPASTLIQGLHALAAAIHPEIFSQPTGLRQIETNVLETQRKGETEEISH
jgi:iron complex transport system substrate-binding protein